MAFSDAEMKAIYISMEFLISKRFLLPLFFFGGGYVEAESHYLVLTDLGTHYI